jgi:glyoxylase-like metal-dependent hydrolase (beta-lactamase superfamily II)
LNLPAAVVEVPKPARYRVGSVDLAVVSDGVWSADAGALMGTTPRWEWEPVLGKPGVEHRFTIGLNSLLIRTPARLVLVDTGMGDKLTGALRTRVFPGDYGYLPQALAMAGVASGDVDVVVNSHLHADHSGWNTAADGESVRPYFERARYYVHRVEVEAARQPNERTRASYLAENFEPLAEAGLLETIDQDEVRVTDEVTIVRTPGHTEGHVSVVISSGGETAIFLGDMIQHEAQLERLPWIAALDIMPLVSLETKRKIVERAVRENALLVCVHNPFPGVGRLHPADDGRPVWRAELAISP